MMKLIGLMDVRSALNDLRFRDLFPELRHEIDRYLADPKCGSCAVPVAREILNNYPDRVEAYFPGRKVLRPDDEAKQLAENNFSVINCTVDELEGRLRKLGPGRKQVAVCRWEDQVTVIINELNVVF